MRILFSLAAIGLLMTTAFWYFWIAPGPTLSTALANKIDPTRLPVNSALASRLRQHVEYLAAPSLRGREPGTEGNRAAARYITDHFRESGLTGLPSLQGFGQEISPEIGSNLLAQRPSEGPASQAPWLLVGAHFDHLGGNFLGADDNASGIAILLEVARLLPALSQHHLLFVAFNAEERPYVRTPMMGSQFFVDHLPPEIGSPSEFKAVVIMDLMGGVHWEPLTDVVFAAGAEKSQGLYRRLKEAVDRETPRLGSPRQRSPRQSSGEAGHEGQAASPSTELPSTRLGTGGAGGRDEAEPLKTDPSPLTPHASRLTVLPLGIHLVEELPVVGQVAFSDYDAFRKEGVPFVFLSSGRTPRYHETTDLPDTLNYERMAETVRWLGRLLRRIDQDSAPYGFEADRLEFADEVANLQPLVAQAAEWETRIPNTSLLSYWRIRRENKWLQALNPPDPTPEYLRRLERISIRIQCLLGDFPTCFAF